MSTAKKAKNKPWVREAAKKRKSGKKPLPKQVVSCYEPLDQDYVNSLRALVHTRTAERDADRAAVTTLATESRELDYELCAVREELAACKSKLYYTELLSATATRSADLEFARYKDVLNAHNLLKENSQLAQQDLETTRAERDHANKDVATLRNDLTAALEHCRDLLNELAELHKRAEATQVALDQAQNELVVAATNRDQALRMNMRLKETSNARGQEIVALLKKLEEERADHERYQTIAERALHKEGRAALNAACRLSAARALVANLHEQLEDKTQVIRAVRRDWARDIFATEAELKTLERHFGVALEKIETLTESEAYTRKKLEEVQAENTRLQDRSVGYSMNAQEKAVRLDRANALLEQEACDYKNKIARLEDLVRLHHEKLIAARTGLEQLDELVYSVKDSIGGGT